MKPELKNDWGSKDWTGKKVLIVDDAKIVRHAVKKVYTAAGMVIAGEAENGVQALDALAKQMVDLVHLDIIMPEMNGIDCMRIIFDKYPDLAVLVSSCLLEDRQVVARLEEEFTAVPFLSKPLTAEALHELFNSNAQHFLQSA
ncbi:MAG: response regulator [Pseudomonadota bacterium]|nr:response regulator [Pseudomonadota bacterium]